MAGGLDRRTFLKGGLWVIGSTLILPRYGLASQKTERRLQLYNVHNGEFFKGLYAVDNKIIPQVHQSLNLFLRDWRSGDQTTIDPRLLHLVHTLQTRHGVGTPCLDVISGYRSPATNQALYAQKRGVAKKSYHCKGQAIDIKVAPHRLADLYRCALAQKKGGVGYYAKSGFIHVDIRPKPITWQG